MPLDRKIQLQLQKDSNFRQKKEAERQSAMKDTNLYYAGIGSRSTPEYILDLMRQLGEKLREDRMILRTGHAFGADQAFEYGAGSAAQIFLPWPTFNQDVGFVASRDEKGMLAHPKIYDDPTSEARIAAASFHPMWDGLTPAVQKLIARNTHQILGPKPQSRPTPVEFVICWTPGGADVGGTGQALRIARHWDIPIYNLANEDDYDVAFEWAWGDAA